jgi:adenylate kinase
MIGPVDPASTGDVVNGRTPAPDDRADGRERAEDRHAEASAPHVVVAGRPGAGKGTQGARLALRLGVQHLSTGDLLRNEIAIQSSLGRAVERLVLAGCLVPTGLIIAIVETNLDGGGYVLDGFPRTVVQAEALFATDALAPTIAIEIVVPARVALARLIARGRSDDTESVATTRLATYATETEPALDRLERRGLLAQVDGHDARDVVEQRVMREIARGRRPRSSPLLVSAAQLRP